LVVAQVVAAPPLAEHNCETATVFGVVLPTAKLGASALTAF
jgi:hypothetical protein